LGFPYNRFVHHSKERGPQPINFYVLQPYIGDLFLD
jgi:hypothetical protein